MRAENFELVVQVSQRRIEAAEEEIMILCMTEHFPAIMSRLLREANDPQKYHPDQVREGCVPDGVSDLYPPPNADSRPRGSQIARQSEWSFVPYFH